ncbi:MAG: hypothetical protein U9Q15_02830 [Patescibacteria group bacterium]|nr:hypothetical protein [Patescibacteria group bacterium]
MYSYTGRTVNYWDITGYNDLGMTDVVYQQLYLQKPGFVPHEDGQVGLFDISDIDIQVSLVSPLSSVTTWTPSYFLSTDGLEYRYMESGDMVFNPTNSDIDIEIYRYSLEDDPEEITISAGQKYIFVQPANKLVLEDNDWRMMRKVDYAVRDINKDKQPDTTLLHGNDDSDGDGLPDTYEDTYSFLSNTQPLDVMLDPDSDGLNMKEEYLAGASPVLADSDGDGVSDRIEIESGTDPIVSNLQSLVAGDIILPGYQTTISSGATLSFDYGSDFSYTTPVSDENITFVIDFHKEDTSVTFRPIYAQDMAYYRIGSQYKASPLYRIDPTW